MIVGAAVLTGMSPVTTGVAAVRAVAVPSTLDAVTTARMVAPTSAASSVYVLPVAAWLTHSRPAESQRCQR